ncbi:MAG: O-antigen ligase family protein, partial [Acidiferrobacterales bacterium]|nr:O-antigen ligase family protein [Acidiferrobacterales bacterium]
FLLIFSRFVLAALHQYTYSSIIGSFSIMSLASIASVGICFLLMPFVKPRGRPAFVLSKSLAMIYCLIGLMIVTAIINGKLTVGIPSFVKWIYLLQLITLIGFALQMDGLRKTLRFFSIAYSFPLLMLVLSIAMRVSKTAELDGSTSYVGGFFHEAVFSTIIFTAAFFMLTQAKKFSRASRLKFFLVLLVFFVLLIFINYRTSIIAFMAMASLMLFSTFMKAKPIQKALLAIGLLIITLFSGSFNFESEDSRFADLSTAYDNVSELITYPENFTREERRLFSGRIYMWSQYITVANEGSKLQILIGRGMGSWQDYFAKYAHNTFVSFYLELGFVGLIIFAGLIIGIYRRLSRIADREISSCGVAFLLGFLILNLGTMPLWSMEGIYCLAFLMALSQVRVVRHRVPTKVVHA